MAQPAPAPRPALLVDRLPGLLVRDVTLATAFAVAIAVGSRIALPLGFTPVPVTAQTFIVLVGAAALGRRRAGAGALLYVAAGVAGVPWFAVTSGATLGYLGGFVLAGLAVGAAAERGLLVRRGSALAVMVGAHVLIYVLGAAVLGSVLGVGPATAVALGVTPFLLGDAIKVVVAAAVVPALVDRTAA